MAKKYQMVRVESSVYDQLVYFRDKTVNAYHSGKLPLPDEECEHLSLSAVIGLLLLRENDKRDRSAGRKKSSIMGAGCKQRHPIDDAIRKR